MSDDFVRLVSQANPASTFRQPQYQPANNGYPPSSSMNTPYDNTQSPQLLDPFFDDEDDMPDSAFGRPGPMQSQESGLPLARSAAPVAGANQSKLSLPADGTPQGWAFDDNQFHPVTPPSANSRSENKPRKQRWKWPWQKEVVLTGERVIALNNSLANREFQSNFVSASKYNLVTFVPKFLTGTCSSVLFVLPID